jgi:sulfide:quinone oxidoreductase
MASIDGARKVAILDDGTEMQFDLFLGVPKHRVPSVVVDSGMAENGWIPVNPRTLETNYPGIYAVGDGANTRTPKVRRGRGTCRGERLDRQAAERRQGDGI